MVDSIWKRFYCCQIGFRHREWMKLSRVLPQIRPETASALYSITMLNNWGPIWCFQPPWFAVNHVKKMSELRAKVNASKRSVRNKGIDIYGKFFFSVVRHFSGAPRGCAPPPPCLHLLFSSGGSRADSCWHWPGGAVTMAFHRALETGSR